MAGNTSSRHVFETLREVCASSEPLGVAEISRRLGLSLSTAQRALVTLTQAGYIKRHPYVPKYRIGFTAERLVNALLEKYRIRASSMLYLRRLAVSSRRTASLYVRIGWYNIRMVGIESPSNPAPHKRRLGEAELLASDAASLAILAFLPDAQVKHFKEFAVIPEHDAVLDQRIASTRAKGYAYLPRAEASPFESIAFPVRSHAGVALASIAVEGRPEPESFDRHVNREEWLSIVREFEEVIQARPDFYTDPFANSDPNHIRFGVLRKKFHR